MFGTRTLERVRREADISDGAAMEAMAAELLPRNATVALGRVSAIPLAILEPLSVE